jgi:hypothetical protein
MTECSRTRFLGLTIASFAICAAAEPAFAERPELPEGYITGTVTSSNGPEAGVWVIAQTDELKTPYVEIVVTDDRGRFVLPELPVATYKVWVRGYGLVDSPTIEGRPGDRDVALKAVPAKTPQEAAQIYPGNYWLSLLQPPAPADFPGTGPNGNGISEQLTDQSHWIYHLKSACGFCHELGTKVTRTLDSVAHLSFKTPEEAWIYRTQLGVRAGRPAKRRPHRRRLDDAHRERRGAARAAAPERCRAQRRDLDVGLGRRPVVHA